VHNLIITLIAISLFSVIALSGVGYINVDSVSAKNKMFKIKSGLSQLSSGIITFRMLFKKYPTDFSQFTPHIVELPELPQGFTLESVGRINAVGFTDKISICISGDSLGKPDIKAYYELNSAYDSNTLLLTDDCSSITEIAPPVTFPANVKIIYTLSM
jgi:hypothetical protein